MLKRIASVFFLSALLLCFSTIVNAAANRISGNGYIFPETQTYKAIFSIDANKDGANPPTGLIKYYYSKTKMSMVSSALTDLTISGVGTTGSISGTCKVNNVAGYTFIMTLSDGRPDSIQIVIRKPSGSVHYSAGPKNFSGGNIVITDTVFPNISITSPQNLITVATSPIQVSGIIDDPTAIVTVNGVQASVSAGSFSVSGITLSEGMNTISAKAIDPANNMATASVNISLDSTPPQVAINSPPDGYTTTADSVDVTGIINDIVRGTVNDNQGSVLVNGVTAEIDNRNFTARSIPLIPGANTITANGSDQWGNLASNSITVNRDTTPRLTLNMESGNGQSGFIGSPLPNPMMVSLKDANNDPISNENVIFRVVENNGTLWDPVAGAGMRAVAVLTDPAGLAGATLTLGSWAGSGNNRVEVSATGVEGTVFFIASGRQKPPAAIYVAQGSQQRGAVNQLLPEPLVAFVTDEGHNPLRDVPVIFTAVEGGGHFQANGLNTITINSDSDGRATVGFVLGPTAGNDGNVIEAAFEGNTLPPAGFTATGLIPGDAGNTRISGVVLDNSNNPIRNVTMKVEGPIIRQALTDANGVFLLSNVPVGPVHLIADGSTAGQLGVLEYPTLMYEITTVSGADNKVSMPIYLVPLDLANSHEITGNETADIIYTLDEVPGFSLTIKPGSATFPDGTKHGRISVTQVHADKVPMVPQIGQQPRFIVTIQPPGTVFDPPAPITIPNVDGLAPGEKTNMYSFDHDLGVFVSIGTGTVSEDGLVIVSDLGVGVVKAGWHCGGNPAPTGSANNCPECQKCVNNRCVADPAKNDTCCGGGTKICKSGSCSVVTLTSVTAKVKDKDEAVIYKGKSAAFTGAAIGTNCEFEYNWDFGDGGTSTAQNPNHTYANTGEYTVTLKVKCKKCSPPEVSDTVKVIVFTASIEKPTGDPVAAGSANNEFTFTGAAGTATIPVKAKIEPVSAEAKVNDNITWRLSFPPAGSTLTWSDTWPGDPTRGKGTNITATLTGYPPSNNSFGLKSVDMYVLVDGAIEHNESTNIELFFERDTTATGRTAPNWFFYWNQTGAGDVDAQFSATPGNFGETPAMLNWTTYAGSRDRVLIGDAVTGSDRRRDGSNQIITGMDLFANTVLHENYHVTQIYNNNAVAFYTGVTGALRNAAAAGWSFNVAFGEAARRWNHFTDADGDNGFDNVAGGEPFDDVGLPLIVPPIDPFEGDGIFQMFEPFTNADGDTNYLDGLPFRDDGNGDTDLDTDRDDLANTLEPTAADRAKCYSFTNPAGQRMDIECQAELRENSAEDAYKNVDWADPGKQHRTGAWND